MAGIKGLVDTSASCGAANPLMKLTAHFSHDKAKTDLGLGGQKSKNKLEEEFVHFQRLKLGQPQTFNLKGLLNELEPESEAKGQLEDQWTREFQNFKPIFDQKEGKISHPLRALQGKPVNQDPAGKWAEDYLKEVPIMTSAASVFSELLPFIPANSISNCNQSLLETLDQDSRFSESEFKAFVHDDPLAANQKWAAQEFTAKEKLMTFSEEWVDEFVDITDADVTGLENPQNNFWANLEQEWQSMAEQNKLTGQHPWLDDYEDFQSELDKYTFQDDNPLLQGQNHPGEDYLEEGKQKLQEGDLPSAVLLFEASVQQNPENPEAWFLLGTSQAKNERDTSAIAALLQTLRLDPGNAEAIIALAASFTNESMQMHGCLALQDWIAVKEAAKHPGGGAILGQPKLQILSTKITSSFMSRELHQQTLDQYLNLTRRQHQSK